MGMKAITLSLAIILINLGISWVSMADPLHTGGAPYDTGVVGWANSINQTSYNGGIWSFLNNVPIVNAIPQATTMFNMLGGLVHALSFDWIRVLLPAQLQHYIVVDAILTGLNAIGVLLIMYTIVDLLRFAIGRFLT